MTKIILNFKSHEIALLFKEANKQNLSLADLAKKLILESNDNFLNKEKELFKNQTKIE